ncbi:MAG: hypothetical protein HQM10_07410 [Candidatus Riflebacteria bacterium]|nr:hypothetical protein [Candidatus Riflebacteria bacterium]
MRRLYVIVLASVVLLGGLPINAAPSPFEENNTKINLNQQVSATSGTTQDPNAISPQSVDQLLVQVSAGNALSGQYGGNHVIKHAIIKGSVFLKDETGGDYERVRLIDRIFSQHGCKLTKQQKNPKESGNFFNKKRWMEATYEFEGKDYVVTAIIGYYSGKKLADVSPESIPTEPDLAEAVALEKRAAEDEKAILAWEFELDKLIVELPQKGAFDFSGKNRIKARMEEINNTLIPNKMSAIAQAKQQAVSKLNALAVSYQNKGDYAQALAYYKLQGINDNATRINAGDCYQALQSYDSAIAMYSAVSPQTETSVLKVADCRHAQGKDAEAAAKLMEVLQSFNNSTEEQAALRKIDEWGILTSQPALAPQISDIYLRKAFINAGNTSAAAAAAADYKRACELKAAGNGAEGSRQIVAGYQAAVNKDNQDINNARIAADSRFNRERENARISLVSAERNYDNAMIRARVQYNEEVRSVESRLSSARSRLSYLQSHPPVTPPSTGGTDPYGGSTKPSTGGSSTDPYGGSTKPSTGGSSTDPYGGSSKPSNSGSSTDPYNAGTDPYSGSSGTDPYSGGTGGSYEYQLSQARAEVSRLERELSSLRYDQAGYIARRTAIEGAALQNAQSNYRRYDLSKKDAYIENDSAVSAARSNLASHQRALSTTQRLAAANGF